RRLVAERQGGPVRLRINARVTLLRGLSRLADVRLGRKLDGRDVTEILLDPCLRLRRIEVADHDERSVVRGVVLLEEALHVLERGGLEILQVAVEVDRKSVV